MKRKKGLSTVVTTLILVLLVLVAVGIIWGVVGNLLDKSSGTIEISTKCLDVDVKAIKVIDVSGDGTIYNVTLKRTPSGEGEIGARVVFFSKDGNTGVEDFGKMLVPLETVTESITLTSTFKNATSVEVTPYFLDTDTNKQVLCPITTTFDFG